MLKAKMVRGLTTGWLQEGQDNPLAPILVFLHGFPDTPHMWDKQINFFSANYLVLAPYLRGVGPSEAAVQKNRYSIDSITMDILAILKEVDPDQNRKIALVAHDIGGLYGWQLARYLDHRLSHVIMVNSVSLDQMTRKLFGFRQLAKSWYIGLFQFPKIPEFILTRFWDYFKHKITQRPELKGDYQLKPKDVLPAINQYRMAFKGVLKRRPVKKIDVPVLVVWGKEDPYLEIPTSSEIQRLAKNFVIRVLDGGHWIHQKQPDRVNALIDQFLKGAPCLT